MLIQPAQSRPEVRPEDKHLAQTRVDIDLGALAHNVRVLKGLIASGTRFMAVVKADAYGHGALQAARIALENGADWLAVARISEAIQLRESGIEAPMLLFGDVRAEQVPYLAAHDICISLAGLDMARRLSAQAQKQKKPLKVHVKVDTGMGRLGILHDQLIAPDILPDDPWESVKEIQAIHALKGLVMEGLYTHLASSDARDKSSARLQVDRLALLAEKLQEKGVTPPLVHAANSAALIDLPGSHLKMVRPGLAMYGLWPSDEMDQTRVSLKPVMSIRSKIIQLKSVPQGFKISYGGTHVTAAPTKIATIPIGYADGYSRQLSNKGEMLVQGIKAPIVGRVCMDFTMIDVGHIPHAALGDEVVILGSQGGQTISATDIARTLGTINYEITASLTQRMPRCYSGGL